ncbi:hypothetical protein AB1046_11315 [Promicromonospora sp. Populi]|uniref:hypothetical protein n=1 Tax=Promicromonospora sp. Populi TaxID=3239420 RepID=UPI0034E2C33F
MRRFLVLTPVAFGVTAVVLVILQTSWDFSWAGFGIGLVAALAVTVGAFLTILLAIGLLRLLGVRNDWAVLGVAVCLAAVICAVIYAMIAASLPENDEGWNLLPVVAAAAASVPTWVGYAVGLLIRGRRDRRSRNRAMDAVE